jgi:hypothetical protein
MKKALLLLLYLFSLSAQAQNKIHNPEITSEEIKQIIYFLASDAMKGRFTGSPEEHTAGEYIKNEFQLYGLRPVFNGKWYQEFPFTERVELTKNNSVDLTLNGKNRNLGVEKDFITAPFSGKAKANGEIVFAGYGISAPKLNYDDYANLDVKGKIVLVMVNNPEHDSSRTEFDRYSSKRTKAVTAKEKGAAGIIFVNGELPKNDDDPLMTLHYDGAPGIEGFPVLQIKRKIADQLLKSQKQVFALLQKDIDSNKKSNSFILKNVKVSLETEAKEIVSKGHNVAGLLEGNDPVLKNEYIVIGAHYDHLGIDQLRDASLYKGKEKLIHHGADDNGSGTTGLLEISEKIASIKGQLKRSIIFIAFSGEELGLFGSAFFVNNPPIELKNVVAMLNMDMIGRLNTEKALTVIGAGTSSKWKELLNEKNKYGFKLGFSDGGLGGSDHQSFSNKGIPVLFFFTGMHPDYHRPTDTADKINTEGEEKVSKYVLDIALAVDDFASRPDFVKVDEPVSRGGGSTRAKVSVGTVPEFGYNGAGYKISGVTDGGPASKAGMKPGDIIVKFGTKTIANIYDFMYAIGDYKAGDKVNVTVLREGKEVQLNVELIAK